MKKDAKSQFELIPDSRYKDIQVPSFFHKKKDLVKIEWDKIIFLDKLGKLRKHGLEGDFFELLTNPKHKDRTATTADIWHFILKQKNSEAKAERPNERKTAAKFYFNS